MRIAFLSDIHGNAIALDAVLDDLRRQEPVDETWLLGDFVAIGPDPIGVLERITALPNARFLRGNTDRYLVSGDRPPPSAAAVVDDPSLLPAYTTMQQHFAWSQGSVAATGWLSWLAELPLELRADLPDGSRLLAVHASPGQDDGSGIRPEMSNEELAALTAEADADLIVVGHTHWPLNRIANERHLVNLGSISLPLAPNLAAKYAVLDADPNGYAIRHRYVTYDREAVIAQAAERRHPGVDLISAMLRGVRPAGGVDAEQPEHDRPYRRVHVRDEDPPFP